MVDLLKVCPHMMQNRAWPMSDAQIHISCVLISRRYRRDGTKPNVTNAVVSSPDSGWTYGFKDSTSGVLQAAGTTVGDAIDATTNWHLHVSVATPDAPERPGQQRLAFPYCGQQMALPASLHVCDGGRSAVHMCPNGYSRLQARSGNSSTACHFQCHGLCREPDAPPSTGVAAVDGKCGAAVRISGCGKCGRLGDTSCPIGWSMGTARCGSDESQACRRYCVPDCAPVHVSLAMWQDGHSVHLAGLAASTVTLENYAPSRIQIGPGNSDLSAKGTDKEASYT